MPPVRVKVLVSEPTANVPSRLSAPVSTWSVPTPVEDQVPTVVMLPVLAHNLPSLVQLVPVTMMVLLAVSALMLP